MQRQKANAEEEVGRARKGREGSGEGEVRGEGELRGEGVHDRGGGRGRGGGA